MSVDLATLADMLRSEAIPSQLAVAKAIGCDQPFISRARAGKIRRVTPRVEKLWSYAKTRIASMQTAPLLTSGGPDEPPRQAKRSYASRNLEDAAVAALQEAKTSFQQYLDDGYDPRLIVDQINVLRRAQSRRK
jgi:hypothetical protein